MYSKSSRVGSIGGDWPGMELTVLRFLGLEVDEGDRPKTGLTVRLVVGTWSGRDGPTVGVHVGGAGRLPEGEAKHLQSHFCIPNYN